MWRWCQLALIVAYLQLKTQVSALDMCTPNPCQNGGECTLNGLEFQCTCPVGYIGSTCDISFQICLPNPCQNNGICTPISSIQYTCNCTSAFTGPRCDENVNECLLENSCAPFANCTDRPNGFECNCIEGYRGDGKRRCYKKILLPYGSPEGDILLTIGDDVWSRYVRLPYEMPFGSRSVYSVRVSSNGLMVLIAFRSSRTANYRPPFDGFVRRQIIVAPFWDDFHPSRSNEGKVYYNLYSNNQLLDPVVSEVKRRIVAKFNATDFNPLFVFKATWSEVVMFPEYSPGHRDYPSTFQAVIASDGCETYLLYIYKEDGMLWQTDLRRTNNALIGYSDGDQLMYEETNGIYRPDQRVQNQGGVDKGQYFYKVPITITEEYQARCGCVKWYLNDILTQWSRPNIPCPCSNIQALTDGNFARSVDNRLPFFLSNAEWQLDYPSISNCFQSVNPIGARCCYGGGRRVLLFARQRVRVRALFRGPFGSRYERFQIPLSIRDPIASRNITLLQQQFDASLEGDLYPRRQCCRDSRSYRYCRLYTERRPTATCRRYRSKVPSFLRGDPHITTLDGNSYTFNGLGEFDLISAPQFRLQGRTARVITANGTEGYATAFVAFIVQDYSEVSGKVLFKLNESDSTGQGITVIIDGSTQTGLTNEDRVVNLIRIERVGDGYKATFPSSQSVTVTASNSILSTEFTGSPDRLQNVTKGLLGHWTGSKEDDFELRNGTVLNYQSLFVTDNTDILSNTLSEKKLYPFGLTWRVTESESLFEYTTGNDTYAAYNPPSQPNPPFLEELVATQRGTQFFNDTLTMCTTDGTLSIPCLYDTLSTGRAELGADTQESGIVARQTTLLNDNTPPVVNITNTLDFIDGRFRIEILANASLQLEATDVNNDTIIYGVGINNTVPVTITQNGLVLWLATTPIQIESAQLFVSVSDSIEETLILIPILYCPCLNNGECLFDGSSNGTDEFQVVSCNCTEAYDGDTCSEDKDGCLTDPCPRGTNCTDVVAPGTGFTCGPCPPGTAVEGKDCVAINLCLTANCSQNCTPTFNSFQCFCRSGYISNQTDNTLCDDINECTDTQPCASILLSECSNTIGSYVCVCPNGTEFVNNECLDINECAQGYPNDCDLSTTSCANGIATYTCPCLNGYERPTNVSSLLPCTDIDECETTPNACNRESENCTNTNGSFICQCKLGFAKDGFRDVCENINECTSNPCPTNLTCIDTIGSYNCSEGELPPLIECKERPIIRLTAAQLHELNVGFMDDIVISPTRLDNTSGLDPKCIRSFSGLVMFEINLIDCSPIITEDDYYISVTYVIRNQPFKDPNSDIARFEDHCFNLTCKFERKSNLSLGSILPSIGKTQVGENFAKANFELEMCFYKNYDFEEKLPKEDLKVYVYDDVFVKISLPNFGNESLILQVTKCFATLNKDSYNPMYQLISDSCPANRYVTVKDNYKPLCGSFKFKSFVWTNISEDQQKIFVSCDVEICYKDDDTSCERAQECANVTSSRRRRRYLPNKANRMRLTSEPLTILRIENNLCEVNHGGCSDECWMDSDIVRCLCSSGRTLGRDEKTCYDRDQLTNNLVEEIEDSGRVVQVQRHMIMALMALALLFTCFVLYKRNSS